MLLTLPVVVFAEDSNALSIAIFVELFCSAHMTAFVLWPLAKLIEKDSTKVKGMVVKLFLLRIVFLAIIDLINPGLFFIEFIILFLSVFTIFPIMISKENKKGRNLASSVGSIGSIGTISRIVGVPKAENISQELEKRIGLTFAKSSDYDNMYLMSETDMLDTYIEKELEKSGYNKNYIPFEMVKRGSFNQYNWT